MIRRLLLVSTISLTNMLCGYSAYANDGAYATIAANIPAPLSQPPAPLPGPDVLITPPGEHIYFPMRPDGQPYYIQNDETVNYTEALNHFYYDPKWRGEEWAPFQCWWIAERAVRLMPTWNEFNNFSTWRRFNVNPWHKFWERYSGYGP